jgi:hypothetical protein
MKAASDRRHERHWHLRRVIDDAVHLRRTTTPTESARCLTEKDCVSGAGERDGFFNWYL